MAEYSSISFFIYVRFLFFLFGLMVFASWYKLFRDRSFIGSYGFFLSSYSFSHPFYRVLFLFLLIIVVPFFFSIISSYFFKDFSIRYLVYLCTVLLEFFCIKFLLLDSVGIGFFFFIRRLFNFDRKHFYIAFQGFFLACFLLFFVSLLNTSIISVYTYYYESFEVRFSDGEESGVLELFEESGKKGYSFSYLERIFADEELFTLSSLSFMFIIICLAPFCEELIFRATILPILSKELGFLRSNLLVSFMFALVHFDIYSFLPLFVLGMLLGFVYLRSRVLYGPVLLHSLWNAQSLLTYLILYL